MERDEENLNVKTHNLIFRCSYCGVEHQVELVETINSLGQLVDYHIEVENGTADIYAGSVHRDVQ